MNSSSTPVDVPHRDIGPRSTLTPPRMHGDGRRRWWKKVAQLAVSAGLMAVLAWRTDWGRLGQAVSGLHFGWWLAAAAAYAGAQVVSSIRWQLLAGPLGFSGSVWRFTRLYFIGMFFNLLLPTSVGGDVVRAWLLDGRPGRRLAAMSSVLLDRASGLLVLLLVGCAGVAMCPFTLPHWIPVGVGVTAGSCLGGVALTPWVVRWSQRLERLRRATEMAQVYLHHPRLVLGTSGLSLVVQAANVGVVWLVGRAMGDPVPGAYYWIFVPMVSLLTVLPVSFNGMGIREATTVLFLTPLGVSESTALCLAFLWFCVLAAGSLLGGVVYFGSLASLLPGDEMP